MARRLFGLDRIRFSNSARAIYLTCAFIVSLLIVSPVSRGMDIIINFKSGNSDFPSYDPDASQLQALFGFAETYYEDIFRGTVSTPLTLDIWYDELSGNTLGSHNLDDQNSSRETHGNIRIDTDSNWFLDPTPEDSSEFNMQQRFFRDLTASQTTDWYDVGSGSVIPETFETGYTGNAFSGTDASGKFDMLSVIMHEVGHAIGMSSSASATRDETGYELLGIWLGGDRDYDFYPEFVFGQGLAADIAADNNIAHLKNANALLTPSVSSSLRRFPSHTDIFSMAAGANWNLVDVPRREFYGGSDWNTSGNWAGDFLPQSDDDVYIRSAQGPGTENRAGLTANGFAANLYVSERGIADTNGFKLDVVGEVIINGADANVYINSGGQLEANLVRIENGGEVRMTGGILDVDTLIIEEGTSLEIDNEGTGTIQVDTLLQNDGLIDTDLTGGLPSSFVFTATSVANPWDLDGSSGDGFVRANDGDIRFNSGGMTDSFDGEIEVGPAFTFHFAENWTNGSGLLDLNGGSNATNRAAITGGQITFNGGELNADDSGTSFAQIDSDIVITGGAIIVGASDRLTFNGDLDLQGGVFTMTAAGARVDANGTTTFDGSATFNMNGDTSSESLLSLDGTTQWEGGTNDFNSGVVQQDGTANVNQDTVINANVFDLDGAGGASTVWNVDSHLTINANQLDTSNNTYHGVLNISHEGEGTSTGVFEVNLPSDDSWTLAGTANAVGATGRLLPFVFSGADIVVSGDIQVTNTVGTSARIDLTGTINTDSPASQFRLDGGNLAEPNRIEGGQITGDGVISILGSRALTGFGTISTRLSMSSGAELRADDGTLSVTGADILGQGTLGTADTDGAIQVNGAWNTTSVSQVELLGGALTGGALTNGTASVTRTISGHGTIASSDLINNGSIEAVGGTLIINTGNEPLLGGSSGTGFLYATNGDLQINDQITTPLDATIFVGATRSLTFANGWTQGAGVLNLLGGTTTNAQAEVTGTFQVLQGVVNVTKQGRFDINTEIASTAVVNLADSSDSLQLRKITSIRAGANFSGDGRIVNFDGATLFIDSSAQVDVALSNLGDLAVGNSPGAVTVDSFIQFATGQLDLGLGGAAIGEYDQFQVTDSASLAGVLNVTLEDIGSGLFSPEVGDQFDILSAASLTGQFTTINLPGLSPGLFWDIDYQPDGLSLDVVDFFLGDLNGDGIVSEADLNPFVQAIINRDAFVANFPWVNVEMAGDINQSGSFDLGDLGPFKALLASLPSDVSSVPEPNSIVLLLMGLALVRPRFSRRK